MLSTMPALYAISCTLQVYEPGKGLAFHFDKDEHAMKEKQQMIQPALSSVLYLSGDCTQERLGTIILFPPIMQVPSIFQSACKPMVVIILYVVVVACACTTK